MAVPLTINGVDFSSYAQKSGGYTVTYEKREGSNSGLMIDGSRTVDILATKAILTWNLNALRNSELTTLLAQINHSDTVSVTYFDPESNAAITGTFIPSISTLEYAFDRNSMRWFKDGTVLTMTEQ